MVDLKMEEQLKGFQKRNLAQTHFYRVASRAFGKAQTRKRVFTAQPVHTLTSIQLSSEQMTNSKKRSVPVVAPGIRDQDHGTSPWTLLPGNVDFANHRDWVEQRRVFRKELDNIGNLTKLFHSKPTVTEIERLVVEREKHTTAPPKVSSFLCSSPDTCKRGAGALLTCPSRLNFDSEQQQRDQRSLPEIRERCPQQLSIVKPELTLSTPSLSQKEKACILQHRRSRGMEDLRDEEGLAIAKPLCQNDARQDAHSQPSSLGGSTGLAVDHFRRQCLGEFLDTLDQCRKMGVAVSQSTLEKGILHPGDFNRGSLSLKHGASPQKEMEEPEEAAPKLMAAYPTRRSVHRKPKMMNLSTGLAKVGHKTECWMTMEEYKDLSGTVNMMPSYQCANPKAFWPGKQDHVRLYLPQVGIPPEEVLFQHIVPSPAPSRGNWPINSEGYYTSGDIDRLKTYIL